MYMLYSYQKQIYTMWGQYICITNNIGTTEIHKIYNKLSEKTTARNVRNATTKSLKNHYKVPMQRQVSYCETYRGNIQKPYKHNNDR